MTKTVRISAVGRTQMLFDSIKRLHRSGVEIPCIVTCEAPAEYGCGVEDFERLAHEVGAHFLVTEQINSPSTLAFFQRAPAHGAISINWKTLIREQVMALFPLGMWNCHPGDLPRYKGNACPNWAILRGEERIGLTVHRMDPHRLDGGAVARKEFFPVGRGATIGDFYAFWRARAPEMFAELVEEMERGELTVEEQEGEGFRCYPRRKEDGEVRWSEPADAIHRLIRASSEPFSGAYSYVNGKKMIFWKVRIERLDEPYLSVPGQVAERRVKKGEVAVTCGRGLVVLEEVEVEGVRGSPLAWISTIHTRFFEGGSRG